jgi:hypothetical protein
MGTNNLHALHLNGGAMPNKYGIVKKKDGDLLRLSPPHTAEQEKLLRTEYQCTGIFCYTMRLSRTPRVGPASSAVTSRRRIRATASCQTDMAEPPREAGRPLGTSALPCLRRARAGGTCDGERVDKSPRVL